jgi:hypothetical protein
VSRGIAGWGVGCAHHHHPRQQSPSGKKGAKINILCKKNFYLLHSPNFKLMSQIKGNSISDCDLYFKFIIPVKGGYCDYSPWQSKKLAMLLDVSQVILILQRNLSPPS